MKLSVCVITYNHAPYIRQAIDAILAQQTNFPFEILIGEDDSKDGTREIVREYEARFPDRIKAFYRDRKDNIVINGRPTGRRNFMETILAARGEYIALLEADDFWTDPQKLQRQVDYLDAHPDCNIVCHHTSSRDETNGKEWTDPPSERPTQVRMPELMGGNFFRFCSVVYRRPANFTFPLWYHTAPVGDTPLYCLCLGEEGGYIHWMPEAMACYRIHAGGVWSTGVSDYTDSSKHRRLLIRQYTSILETSQLTNAQYGYRYDRQVRPWVAFWAWELVWLYHQEHDWAGMRKFWRIGFLAAPFRKVKLPFLLKSLLVSHFPWLSRRPKPAAA